MDGQDPELHLWCLMPMTGQAQKVEELICQTGAEDGHPRTEAHHLLGKAAPAWVLVKVLLFSKVIISFKNFWQQKSKPSKGHRMSCMFSIWHTYFYA